MPMKGTWSRTSVGGKAADVYQLTEGVKPRFGVLFLHPYGLETLVDRPAFTDFFDELHLACVCPHGQHSWWTDRICGEFDAKLTAERYVLDQVLPFFAERFGLA